LPTNPDIIGRDEAYSTKFQGYSVWLYGDTALAKPDASSRTFLSNAWSYTTDFDATNGIAGFQERLDSVGSPSMLIQETPDELSFISTLPTTEIVVRRGRRAESGGRSGHLQS
jgi:hypothetical protein